MSEFQKDARAIERRQRRIKRSNNNEANQPRDTLWNHDFLAGYSNYMSLSLTGTRAKMLSNQVHSFRKAEDVCVSATSNILTDRSRPKCNTQVKQSDYCTTKTGEQMVSVANTEGRPDANDYLGRRNADGEFGREDTPPPPRPPKSKYKAHQSLRQWIETREYVELLRRREHGEWNVFGKSKRRKSSPAYPKSSDRQVRVQPVTVEAEYAEGIDAVTLHKQLKSLLVDKSEPSFEKLMRLSCELKNYIALRREKMQVELAMASTRVFEAEESQQDRSSSLAPSRVVSPDEVEQRTSVNCRSGHQSLTENANASAPQSVRKGGSSVRSPQLTQSTSASSLSSAGRMSEGANKKERKGCLGRGKKKNEDANKQDLSRASKRTSSVARTASKTTGVSVGKKSINEQKPRGCCGCGKNKSDDETDLDLSSELSSEMSTVSRRSKESSVVSFPRKSSSKPGSPSSAIPGAEKVGLGGGQAGGGGGKPGGEGQAGRGGKAGGEGGQAGGGGGKAGGEGGQAGGGGGGEYSADNPSPATSKATTLDRSPSAFGLGPHIGASGVDVYAKSSPVNQLPFLNAAVGVTGGVAGADGICRCSFMLANQAPYWGPNAMTPPPICPGVVPAICVPCQSPAPDISWPSPPAVVSSQPPSPPLPPPPPLPWSPVESESIVDRSEPIGPSAASSQSQDDNNRLVCGDYEESSSKRPEGSSQTEQEAGVCCFPKKRIAKSANSEDSLDEEDALSRRSVGSFKKNSAFGRKSREESNLRDSSVHSASLAGAGKEAESSRQQRPARNTVGGPKAEPGATMTPSTAGPEAPVPPTLPNTVSPPATPIHKQSSFSSYARESPSKRVTISSAPGNAENPGEGGGGVGGEGELEVRKRPPPTAEIPPPVPPTPPTPVSASAMPVQIPPSLNNVPPPAYQVPNSQMPEGMQCRCTMCPMHCMALMCPQFGQLTMNQPTPTHSPTPPPPPPPPPSPPPAPMATSPKVTTGATMDCTSHMGKVQSPDQATTAISVEPPNGPSSQPIVHMASSDVTKKCSAPLTGGRATGAHTHTIEIKFHGDRMSSVNVATTNADSNRPAAAAIEQSEGTKSSASPATFKSDMPAAAATSRSLSPTSVGSRPSKLSGGSSDADGEQEGGKGCGGKCYCKRKPEAKHNDSRTSKLFERSTSKASTNTEGSLTPGGKRPSQRRSMLSCYKKQTSEKADAVTGRAAQAKPKTLRLVNGNPSDERRKLSKTKSTGATRPSQRRSLTSCFKKGAGAGTQTGQRTLRLTNAYMSDDGRKPEFAQPFEYSRCRSASYGMAAPYENGLPGARMQAQLHTVAVNPQPSRFTCVSAGVDKAKLHQPAFHSAVSDLTKKNEATRPWMPRRPDGRSPDDVCSPTPTTDTRFIVGERPVSPAGAGQTVMVNTQENSLASPCNGIIVECSMQPGGLGQQSQTRCKCPPRYQYSTCPRMRPPGPTSFMGGPGQAVWVLMPMAMGATGMVGNRAHCARHGRR